MRVARRRSYVRAIGAWLLMALLLAPPGLAAGKPDGECESGLCGAASDGPAYVPGQLLVRFRPGVPAQRAQSVLAAQHSQRLRRIEPLGIDLVNLPTDLPVEKALERFANLPEVEFAEPNVILRIAAVSDPGLANQWAPQRIEAPAAWDITTGDPSVIIAVVDSGIDYQHSELAPNIWQNPGEIPGNGVDDDENGFVDDVRGWDFSNGDADPLDDNNHGTHVAGIVAADDNDHASGLVGVCPDCTLMAVKVLSAEGSGPTDVVASGITYAARNGAKVINLSLIGTLSSPTQEAAVNYAWGQGAVVVAAAGNDGKQTVGYPAGYANAMAVASSNSDDLRSCFSNYSTGYIDVAAPGELIYSTLPRDEFGADSYGTYSGTSMASPHVAGLAGLLFSQDPEPSNADVRAAIAATANDLGPSGTDAYFGAGRINAYGAVSGTAQPALPPSGLAASSPTASGYAHTRKLVRDANGTLHLAWHYQDGGLYQVQLATSTDDGQTWSAPEEVFSSVSETAHPALALGSDHLYLAFPSQHGGGAFQVYFTRRELTGGAWSAPVALLGGDYDAVRPDLYVDPSNGHLHLVASSLDNATDVYYRRSVDGGVSWDPVRMVNPTTPSTASNSRYATVHAHGANVYIAARTVGSDWLYTYYYLHTVRSTDGGTTWLDQTKISSFSTIPFFGGGSEYGVSLAGAGDRLYMVYEVGGGVYFRRWDGAGWSDYVLLEEGGRWPTVTQADDGQAWMQWVDAGGNLFMRHYTGSTWEPGETLLAATPLSKAYYPNLRLGFDGSRLDWVQTRCPDAPFTLVVDGRWIIPTAVDLLDFRAMGLEEGVVLSWETTNEVDNLGFNVYRAMSVDGSRAKLNDTLMPPNVPPGSPFGASYEFLDADVTPGVTYYYWLEDVDIYGATTLHGPVEAQVQAPARFDVQSFTAEGEKGKITLRWETANEMDVLGFSVWRAKKVDGEKCQVNDALIGSLVAVEDRPGGANYQFEDGSVRGARTYWYWLEVVDTAGASELFGPLEASAR